MQRTQRSFYKKRKRTRKHCVLFQSTQKNARPLRSFEKYACPLPNPVIFTPYCKAEKESRFSLYHWCTQHIKKEFIFTKKVLVLERLLSFLTCLWLNTPPHQTISNHFQQFPPNWSAIICLKVFSPAGWLLKTVNLLSAQGFPRYPDYEQKISNSKVIRWNPDKNLPLPFPFSNCGGGEHKSSCQQSTLGMSSSS